MDFSSLSRLVADAVPSEYRKVVVDALDELSNALDPRTNKPGSIYDEVRNDVGDPPGSFEDIVKGFEQGDALPDAESGGTGVTVDSITRDIYRFMTEHDEDYAAHNVVYEEWNAQHPLYVTIDYLKYLGEADLTENPPKGAHEA